jgi:hypothetical protein
LMIVIPKRTGVDQLLSSTIYTINNRSRSILIYFSLILRCFNTENKRRTICIGCRDWIEDLLHIKKTKNFSKK